MQIIKNLTIREQLVLSFAFIALLGLSFHALIWEPINTTAQELKEQLEQEQNDLDWIKQNIHKINARKVQAKAVKGSLISWLDLRVKKHQLKPALKRIKPRGNNEVKIWLEQANVKQLMNFLAEITQYTIHIKAIKLQALDEPGVVNANFVLERQT